MKSTDTWWTLWGWSLDPWCDAGQQCPAEEIFFKLEKMLHRYQTIKEQLCPAKNSWTQVELMLNLCVNGGGSGDTEEQVGAASSQEPAACDAPKYDRWVHF